MSANNLLLLLSAKTQGTWAQFRAAVEELHIPSERPGPKEEVEGKDLPLYHKLQLNLQRLAHVEFRTSGCTDGWRVTPPTFALVQHGHISQAVLCGARSKRLLDQIASATNETVFVATALDDAPDRITITADHPDSLRQVANQAGVCLQEDAPTTLLAALAPIEDVRRAKKSELPLGPGWQVDRFSTSERRWTEASTAAALVRTGLFRFQLGFQRFYYYCSAGAAHEIPVQVGKYIALRRYRQKVVSYDRAERSLSVPPIFRPPMLIERALILCSGSLPEYNTANGLLTYADVPPLVARLASQLLRQEAA